MIQNVFDCIDWLPETTFIIANKTTRALPNAIQGVEKIAKNVLFNNNLGSASVCALQALRKGPAMIIIYSDVTGQIIEDLFAIRQSVRSAPLLLIAEHTNFDDLSTERAAICDATIKEPRDAFHLATGMIAAHNNFREISLRRPDEA